MTERVRRKEKSKSVVLASAKWTLFDQPDLLEGEDAAAYQELLARVRAAVKPVDIIEDMFVADVVALGWEVLRWRRLKRTLIQELALTDLREALRGKLDYSRSFADALKEILQENVPKDHSQDFAQLAHACARDEPDALDKAKTLLDGIGFDLDGIREDVQTQEDKKFLQSYLRHEPAAVSLVNEMLAEAGTSMDGLVVDVVTYSLGHFERLDHIERIDRLTAVAEARRNASLREIDRRRALLAEALRRTLPEVEGEFEVIEAKPAKGEKAA
jgi:hypothetical protein